MNEFYNVGLKCVLFIDRFPMVIPGVKPIVNATSQIGLSIFKLIVFFANEKKKNEKFNKKSEVRKNLFVNISVRIQEFEKKYTNMRTKWDTRDAGKPLNPLKSHFEDYRKEIWFKKEFDRHELKIMFPHIEEDPLEKALRKQQKIENQRRPIKIENYDPVDILFKHRIVFKVCCIFLSIYGISVI